MIENIDRNKYKKWHKKNYNFMCPNLVKFKILDDKVVELSRSRETREGSLLGMQYGVSVIVSTSNSLTIDVSESETFSEYEKALQVFKKKINK